MTLADTAHGPDWALYGLVVLLAAMAALLLSGRGSWLIAGYNTAPKERKARYDEKKLCRVTGAGLVAIDLLVLFMALFENLIPASWAWFFVAAILVIGAVMVILGNKLCKKR